MDRDVDKRVFQMMIQEVFNKEYLADICKVALLKIFAGYEPEPRIAEVLYEFLQECCEKGLVFPFYMKYPRDWLRKLQLYDKVFVSYRSELGGKVEIVYQINEGNMDNINYRRETMIPTYENLYVKEFVLYQGESLRYYFCESAGEQKITSPKEVCLPSENSISIGRYGFLNRIATASAEKRRETMLQYKREDEIAKQIFQIH